MSDVISTVEYRDLSSLGFPGYRVGNDGTVWTCRVRTHTKGVRGGGSEMGTEWKQLNPCPNNLPPYYLGISLINAEKKYQRKLVHRLVLEAFVGPPPIGMQCRHLDGNEKDNRLTNLQWGTAKENSADRVSHGRQSRICGDQHKAAKVTSATVIAIRCDYAAGAKMKALAEKHNLSIQNINNIVNRWTWKHISPDATPENPNGATETETT